MFRRWWFGAAVVAAALMPCAQAQFTAARVTFRNPGPFSQADLEATAGVHAGDRLSLDTIRAAAQRLMDCEFFSDVKVDSSGPASALQVIFVLTPLPATHMQAVNFENLVWLTPAAARAAVHAKIPLFEGELPEPYDRLDGADAALAAALNAKGVNGAEVTHEVVEPTTANPVRAVNFRVVKPMVVVGPIEVSGLQPPLETAVEQIAGKLEGTVFAESTAPGSTTSLLLKPLLDAGMLDASVTVMKVTPLPATGDRLPVQVTAMIAPGDVYRVGGLSFAGTPVVSAQALAGADQLHPGDVASRARLLKELALIDAAYQERGYMDEYVDTGAVLDPQTHTVAYKFTVVPGAVYRVGHLNVQGLSPEARAQFETAWLLKTGDLYDAEYVRGFLAKNTAMQSLAGYVGSFQAAADPDTHLVDLTVTFVRVKSGL